MNIDLSVRRIDRRIGMSGGLFVSALLRETGRTLSGDDIAMLQIWHSEEYLAQADSVRPLPGAAELLATLTEHKIPWAIATSSYHVTAVRALAMLGLPPDTPLVTRDMVAHAKPDPDLFLAAAALLGIESRHAFVVGDSVWDRWPPAAPGQWGSACCPAATAGRNWSGPVPTGSTPTRPTCSPAPTRSGSASARRVRPKPEA